MTSRKDIFSAFESDIKMAIEKRFIDSNITIKMSRNTLFVQIVDKTDTWLEKEIDSMVICQNEDVSKILKKRYLEDLNKVFTSIEHYADKIQLTFVAKNTKFILDDKLGIVLSFEVLGYGGNFNGCWVDITGNDDEESISVEIDGCKEYFPELEDAIRATAKRRAA